MGAARMATWVPHTAVEYATTRSAVPASAIGWQTVAA